MAFCGLMCTECSIYKATLKNDPEYRHQIALAFSTPELILKEADINCSGCTTNGCLYIGCHDCAVRKCAVEKNIAHCGQCPSFPCDNLDIPFEYDPQNRERLRLSV